MFWVWLSPNRHATQAFPSFASITFYQWNHTQSIVQSGRNGYGIVIRYMFYLLKFISKINLMEAMILDYIVS